MSQSKNSVESKSQVQDPEAILSMENILENEEHVQNSSSHKVEQTTGITEMCYGKALESTNIKTFEYPIVTINGKPTLESRTIMQHNPSPLISSKVHAVSEPNLADGNLYINQNDLPLTDQVNNQDAAQRCRRQNIGKTFH